MNARELPDDSDSFPGPRSIRRRSSSIRAAIVMLVCFVRTCVPLSGGSVVAVAADRSGENSTSVSAAAVSEVHRASENQVRRALFADVLDQESAADLLLRAADVAASANHPALAAFEFLQNRLLPPDSGEVRIPVEFSPLHWPSAGSQETTVPQTRFNFSKLRHIFDDEPTGASPNQLPLLSGDRMGGRFICPSLYLVELAAQSNQLVSLLDRIDQIQPHTEVDHRNRLALRSVLLLRSGQREAALACLDDYYQSRGETAATAADLLLLEAGGPDAEFLQTITSYCTGIVSAIRSANRWEPFERQFRSLYFQKLAAADGGLESKNRDLRNPQNSGRETEAVAAVTPGAASHRSKSFPQWSAVDTTSALTAGVGMPRGRWHLIEGGAQNVVSQHDDFLYFQSPLTGDFQVECDFHSFGWTDTELLACGTWVSPVYTHKAIDVGDIRGRYQRIELQPALDKIRERYHARSRVGNGQVATYLNGRLVHTQPLPPDHDPWIAVRNDYKNEGGAFDVRITGSPVIPETLHLTAAPRLDGWRSYDETSVSWSHSHWRHINDALNPNVADNSGPGSIDVADAPSAGGLCADRTSYPHDERALFYHRPMLEDGVIRYEFLYRAGQTEVHPALDRLCFVLTPEGVREHWLTDGRYDRTGVAADNLSPLAGAAASLPLKGNQWNVCELRLVDNTVTLVLNGQTVHERLLNDDAIRRFGFFHFADRSDVRIRNVTWTGDWPRELPAVADQLLAEPEEAELANVAHLQQSFDFDFRTEPLADSTMALIRGAAGENAVSTDAGLEVQQPGSRGYRNVTVSPSVSVGGDFDITVRYRDFRGQPAAGGSCSLLLIAMFEPEGDEAFVSRRHMQHREGVEEHRLQCIVVDQTPAGERRDYFVTKAMEETSGRLRLSRRGDMVYYLTAEGDSPNFRLRGRRQFSTAPVAYQGIRVVAQSHRQSPIEVVWEDLQIRAEQLQNSPIDFVDDRVQVLDQQRELLPMNRTWDLTETARLPNEWRTWNTSALPDEWQPGRGLEIVCNGADSGWPTAGMDCRRVISGDFDLSVEVSDVDLAVPGPGEQSLVMVEVQFLDDRSTHCSALFNLTDAGFYEAVSQNKLLLKNGQVEYRKPGRRPVKSVQRLRLARRNDVLTVTALVDESDREVVVGVSQVPTSPVIRSVVQLHTGGPDRQSEMRVRKIALSATRIDEPLQDRVPTFRLEPAPKAPQPTESKSLLRSFLDSFSNRRASDSKD